MWILPDISPSNYVGYRLKAFVNMGRVWDWDTAQYSVCQFKIGRLIGTYDWYIENLGSTVNVGPGVGDRPYGDGIGIARKYSISTPRFIANDGYTWYLGLYYSGQNLDTFRLNVGTRHVKTGDVSGTVLAMTPQTYTPLMYPVYLPPLCVNSIRGILLYWESGTVTICSNSSVYAISASSALSFTLRVLGTLALSCV